MTPTRAQIEATKAEWRATIGNVEHIRDALAVNELTVGAELSRQIAEKRATLANPTRRARGSRRAAA